jgi:hypothetical protein
VSRQAHRTQVLEQIASVPDQARATQMSNFELTTPRTHGQAPA